MADEESTLGRWARRKTAARQPVDIPEPQGIKDPADAPVEKTQASEQAAQDDIASLPDIDTLDEKSDFSAFMKDGVPEELKTRALRKLWRLDPAFAHVDGLLDYDDDFTDAALVVEGLKTVYKVGKGMRSEEDETEEVSVADADAQEGVEQVPDPNHPNTDAADDKEESDMVLTHEPGDAFDIDTADAQPEETTKTGATRPRSRNKA